MTEGYKQLNYILPDWLTESLSKEYLHLNYRGTIIKVFKSITFNESFIYFESPIKENSFKIELEDILEKNKDKQYFNLKNKITNKLIGLGILERINTSIDTDLLRYYPGN